MDRGDKAIKFMECLKHSKGKWAGKHFHLEQWQREPIARIFGTLNAEGLRTYRTVFWYVPRKNGKSFICAAIALAMLVIDGEAGAEIYSAAADREQASLVFNMACDMVRQSPTLSKILSIRESRKTIYYKAKRSFYKAISADAHTKHGFSASCIIADELHAWQNRELWDVLTTSTAARQQPLVVALTTAGYDRNSICYELYTYAKKVASGDIPDPTFLPVIYEAAPEDDYKSEATWKKANPNYGISVNPEYFKQEIQKTIDQPSYLNTFLRLHLNIFTEASQHWLDQSHWAACGQQPAVDWESLKGAECWGSLDLSSTTDITALVLAFRWEEGWALLPHFWIPSDSMEKRARRDKVPYPTWKRQGHLLSTDGNVLDYDCIRAKINELGKLYNIRSINIDRWNATQLSVQLCNDGFKVIPFGQGYASMSAPAKEFEKLVLGHKLYHGSNPVLNWMAGNVVAEMDAAGNVKPSKSKSTEKIDGIVASIMALAGGLADTDAGLLPELAFV